ncbi:hypothetical protein BCR44DRAFT_173291 [Catenaria anguillulae PL171]|uniref:Uncharacterized protein n=1 Tax=Catenaria anguillulae PL171 TaxID=765915 RepID=A0A1Y2H9I4_9FUNG|nr:hypothetical protein BCR44DRAFT_173291 [Catenaria anguillulae PL171]
MGLLVSASDREFPHRQVLRRLVCLVLTKRRPISNGPLFFSLPTLCSISSSPRFCFPLLGLFFLSIFPSTLLWMSCNISNSFRQLILSSW